MERKILPNWVFGVAIVFFGLVVMASQVFANSIIPEQVTRWEEDCGYVCFYTDTAGVICYPCLNGERNCDDIPTSTPKASLSETPTNPKPTPTSSTVPTATEDKARSSCNRGTGNGPEECDPGNSGGKPGNAGEVNDG